MAKDYRKFSKTQIEKIGNTIIYLAEKVEGITKTKLLKLLYILDELAISKSGIPFLNLTYKVYKFGPVPEDVYVEFYEEPILFKGFFSYYEEKFATKVKPLKDFNDDEFSDNDMKMLDFVIRTFAHKTAKELIDYTHRIQSPWYKSAVENDVLDLLESGQINNTEFVVDMSSLIAHDQRKLELFKDYILSTCHIMELNICNH